MRSLIVTALLAVVSMAASPKWHQLDSYSFDQFIVDQGRRYAPGSAEYDKRKAIFEENMKEIRTHNADGSWAYKKGVNQFTDVTKEEFRAYNRYEKAKNLPPATEVRKAAPDASVPPTKDWRLATNPRVLTSIKNQGMCGNCWAHSATESMEAYFAMLTGQLPVLSTQQITSCTSFMNGCGGGDATAAWVYVNSTEGLTSEWAYPFVDIFAASMSKGATAPCKDISKEFKPFNWVNMLSEVGIEGYGTVSPSNNADAAKEALANKGPMSISVASLGWQHYESGVYQNNGNSTDDWQIDHAVQMVGYGSDETSGKDYWIVRNSWSTLWGEEGFIRLDRPSKEPCNFFGSICGTAGCLNGLNYPKVFQQKTKHF